MPSDRVEVVITGELATRLREDAERTERPLAWLVRRMVEKAYVDRDWGRFTFEP